MPLTEIETARPYLRRLTQLRRAPGNVFRNDEDDHAQYSDGN
jgi:hypothetical protein